MTYQETIDYLYSRLPVFHRIGKAAYKADLTNTLALCEHLGNPQHQFKSIHVAGTNGKGSTSHMLAAVLQSAGYKTGLYTSPHLKSFTERIKINGVEMPQEAVVQFVENSIFQIEQTSPSFFELTVAMAFDYFAREKVDIAVIEVGLGGRLDSTNVITPELSIITNISWDHADILGDSLEKIAYEKAGIIKPGVPVVISEWQPETEAVFIEKARLENADIFYAENNVRVREEGYNQGKRMLEVTVRKHGTHYVHTSVLLDLLGDYQFRNLIGVWMAVEILREKQHWEISDANILEGLANTTTLTGLKGRWQILSKKPLTLCDTGHNEGGIRLIVEQLERLPYGQLHIIIGTVNDKDLTKILSLLPKNAFYYFCQANIPRALPAGALAQQAATFGLQGSVIPNVNEALADARKNAAPEDVIFIGGSTFVVAELDGL